MSDNEENALAEIRREVEELERRTDRVLKGMGDNIHTLHKRQEEYRKDCKHSNTVFTLSKQLGDLDHRVGAVEERQEGAMKERIDLADRISQIRHQSADPGEVNAQFERVGLDVGKLSARLADLEERVRWLVDQLPPIGGPDEKDGQGNLREDQ